MHLADAISPQSGLEHAQAPSASSIRGYNLALIFVALALISTQLVQHLFLYPFLFLFFAAVMIAAWVGGMGPGLFSVLLSTLAVDYYFLEPIHSFRVSAPDVAYFLAFVLSALAGTWVSSAQRDSQAALRAARDMLEIRVAERTTELRQANEDLRERDRQLRMLEHLARILTIGELTASIAHEVNQPIGAVVTYGHACLEWLAQDPPNMREARHAAERIIQDGSRAGAVISRIHSLFKGEASIRERLEMNQLIHEFIMVFREETVRDHILIHTDFCADLASVQGDRVQLQQVLQNLVVNGMDALHDISGRARELWITTGRENANEIVVKVKDCGVGLSSEVADKIFQPFFTTKPRGIGVGLSISRSIIEAHGGNLTAYPNPEGGATFQFTLPVDQADQHD